MTRLQKYRRAARRLLWAQALMREARAAYNAARGALLKRGGK